MDRLRSRTFLIWFSDQHDTGADKQEEDPGPLLSLRGVRAQENLRGETRGV